MSDCRVAIFDEPTDGLDRDGTASVYSIMNDLSKQECTIVVISHDKKIIKNASQVIDFSVKPVPRISQRVPRGAASPLAQAEVS
jgi:ATP-binding cassette subfamily C protein LapB